MLIPGESVLPRVGPGSLLDAGKVHNQSTRHKTYERKKDKWDRRPFSVMCSHHLYQYYFGPIMGLAVSLPR